MKVVITGKSRGGMFPYRIYGAKTATLAAHRGLSRVPLLDACRIAKRMGEPAEAPAELCREGDLVDHWDLRTTVGYGAAVRER